MYLFQKQDIEKPSDQILENLGNIIKYYQAGFENELSIYIPLWEHMLQRGTLKFEENDSDNQKSNTNDVKALVRERFNINMNNRSEMVKFEEQYVYLLFICLSELIDSCGHEFSVSIIVELVPSISGIIIDSEEHFDYAFIKPVFDTK